MGRAVDPLLWVLAGFLASVPAGHFKADGLAAGFISLLAICILIDVAGWVIRR